MRNLLIGYSFITVVILLIYLASSESPSPRILLIAVASFLLYAGFLSWKYAGRRDS
jgi:hypothetical protein